MGIVTAKYAHQASGYNQLLHADYPNHMLVVPRHDPGYQQAEFFVYLTDVTSEDGATRFVSWQKTKHIPVEQHTLNYVDYADLYAEPSEAAAPAGSVVAYRPDVYHRSADFTDPPRYRVMLHVSFRHREAGWGGYQAWPFQRFLPRAHKIRPAGNAAPARTDGRAPARPSLLERGDAGRRAGPLPGPRHDPLEGRPALTLSRLAAARPGTTSGQGMSRSATSARSRRSCSRWCPASTCSPTGNPSTRPAGMLTAGLPLRLDGAVSAALFMMARAKPISWMRSRPGMVEGGGPSASKATSGWVEQNTKSASSKRSAMAPLTCRR